MEKSAERAHTLGCDAYQIFTASPRQWKAAAVPPAAAAELKRLRQAYRLAPLVVHANYLINLAAENKENRDRSLAAFRGELERAAAIGAEYLVLHPGSGTVERCTENIQRAAKGFAWGTLTLLIENTAGSGNHLGGNFGAVSEILKRLPGLPVGACIDTCHAWVSGYDLVSPAGYAAAIEELESTIGLKRVPVFHANDAKAEMGSHRDRHEHIGEGKLGAGTFRRLLCDPRLDGKAFILETPVDEPEDQARDLAALRRAAKLGSARAAKRGARA